MGRSGSPRLLPVESPGGEMRSGPTDDSPGAQPGFDYFVLRIVRASGRAGESVHGTVERLGTQQKRDFAGTAELLRLLGVDLTGDRMRG
ncbi:MAG: hypothetical protein MNPFHGCM_01443 [Gemmatimonadaceae bacterium]|nr:hypothetical protein [Gemmatimonadaceae bacterium]